MTNVVTDVVTNVVTNDVSMLQTVAGLFCDLRCGGLWPLGLDGNSPAAERLPRLLGTRQLLDLGRGKDIFDPFGVGTLTEHLRCIQMYINCIMNIHESYIYI